MHLLAATALNNPAPMIAGWFLMLIIVLAAVAIYAVVRHVRRSGDSPASEGGSFAGILVALAGIGLGVFAIAYTGQRRFVDRPQPQRAVQSAPRAGDVASNDAIESIVKAAAAPQAEAEPGTSSPPADAVAPPWTNEPPHRRGEVYIVAVSSGDVSDAALRDEALDLKLVAAANRYIDEILYRQGGVAERLHLDPQWLRANYVREQFPPTGYAAGSDRLYARLELDKTFRDDIDERHRQVVSHDRLRTTGGITGGVLALLAGAFAFLKLGGKRA